MREAVGGSFLFNIMIVFIFFFASFMAIAINYAQAFKTKNQIINALEQAEGYNETSRETIEQIQSSTGYFREITDSGCKNKLGDNEFFVAKSFNPEKDIKGICIKRNPDSNNEKAYYTVTTFIHFDFPIIGDFITIPVTGETKLIVNDNYES